MASHWSVHLDPIEWAEASDGESVVAARTRNGLVIQRLDEKASLEDWAQTAAVLGLRLRNTEVLEYALMLIGEVEQADVKPNPDLPHQQETLVMMWADRTGERAMILVPFTRVAGIIAWDEPFAMDGAEGHLDFDPIEAAFWKAAAPPAG